TAPSEVSKRARIRFGARPARTTAGVGGAKSAIEPARAEASSCSIGECLFFAQAACVNSNRETSAETIPPGRTAARVAQSFRLSNLAPPASRSMKHIHRTRRLPLLAGVLVAPLGLATLLALTSLPTGCSGSDVTPRGNGGAANTDACSVDDDCTF